MPGTESTDRLVESVTQLAATPGFATLRDEIVALGAPRPGERVLDVGAGTGLLTFPAAAAGAQVTAIDRSEAMCGHLRAALDARGTANVTVLCADATALPLPAGSVDLALSNYCLHHLDDADKLRALGELARVLRPGGRLVIGDMMFRVSLAGARDRRVLARFARRMLARGPAGAVRLLRNVGRLVRGGSEHPASAAWWREALARSGFADVSVRELSHEGGIASGRLPG